MVWPQNAMDVFKLLNKSNCKECGQPTCLAFAASVFKGENRLNQCPHIEKQYLDQYGEAEQSPKRTLDDFDVQLEQMKQEISSVDLVEAAHRVGGHHSNGKLTIKIMGKDFSVDSSGRLLSDIHIHGWVALPFFQYILQCRGVEPSGKWVPLRELENGRDWATFFSHRCEKPIKKVADTYTDLFEDLVHLFNGKKVDNHYQSDISLVLHPLPKLPMLICYWKPEDGMESDLNLFFDADAEKNLPIESIYILGAGLVIMFEKIAMRHGVPV